MSGIAFNDDWTHFFCHHGPDEMNEAGLRAFVRQYEGTQLTDFFLNPNGMRTVYRSNVRESIFTGFDPENPADPRFFYADKDPAAWTFNEGNLVEYATHTWMLDQAGIDPYAVWIDELRRMGVNPWISMRMNDVHDAYDESSFLHDAFWREHPQFRRAEYRYAGDWSDRTLDYGRPQVRAYQLALVQELIARYDMHGLELDWMRTPPHFRPGYDETGIGVLNAFMREVRTMLDGWEAARGHAIRLSVRVPFSPEAALGLGMDAAAWARNRWVDWITLSPYFSATPQDMPIRLWRQLLEGTGVTLAACTDIPVAAYPGAKPRRQSSATARGFAAMALGEGADKVYLFNHYDNAFTIIDLDRHYRSMLCEVGAIDTLRSKARRHVVTYADIAGVGMARPAILPARLAGGRTVDVCVNLGDVAAVGGARVVLAAEGKGGVQVRFNGEPCAFCGVVTGEEPCPEDTLSAYAIPAGVLHNGRNNVELRAETDQAVTWLEVDIR